MASLKSNTQTAGNLKTSNAVNHYSKYLNLIAEFTQQLKNKYIEWGLNSEQLNLCLIEIIKRSVQEVRGNQQNEGIRSNKTEKSINEIIMQMLNQNKRYISEILIVIVKNLQIQLSIVKDAQQKMKQNRLESDDLKLQFIQKQSELKILEDDFSEDSSFDLQNDLMLSRKFAYKKSDEDDSTDESLKRKDSSEQRQIRTSLNQLMYKTKILKNLLEMKLASRCEQQLGSEILSFRNTLKQSFTGGFRDNFGSETF